MTTGKQLERISGAVDQVNAKQTGIKVLGEWLNVSQYHPISLCPSPASSSTSRSSAPSRGARIVSLQVLEAGAHRSAPSRPLARSRHRENVCPPLGRHLLRPPHHGRRGRQEQRRPEKLPMPGSRGS